MYEEMPEECLSPALPAQHSLRASVSPPPGREALSESDSCSGGVGRVGAAAGGRGGGPTAGPPSVSLSAEPPLCPSCLCQTSRLRHSLTHSGRPVLMTWRRRRPGSGTAGARSRAASPHLSLSARLYTVGGSWSRGQLAGRQIQPPLAPDGTGRATTFPTSSERLFGPPGILRFFIKFI